MGHIRGKCVAEKLLEETFLDGKSIVKKKIINQKFLRRVSTREECGRRKPDFTY